MRKCLTAVSAATFCLGGAAQAEEFGNICAGLMGHSLTGGVITASRVIEESPAHCVVHGIMAPRIGQGTANPVGQMKTYGAGFELRLPQEWNGRFVFQGGGGLDGWINPARGVIDRSQPEDSALARGYAVVNTDSGHTGVDNSDGSFGVDAQARIDNAYNAVDIVATGAEEIIATAYGNGPEYSYFHGCSNGGRQGMIAAVRYPDRFDGIIAGAPAKDLVGAVTAWNWNTRALMKAAPKDGNGDPIISKAFSDADLSLLQTAALNACDAADGLEDGLIDDVSCRFDPAVLLCEGDKTDECLTQAQVDAAQAIYDGPSLADGTQLYGGLMPGAETGPGGWRSWVLGNSPTAQSNGRIALYQHDWLRFLAFPEPRPDMDPLAEFDPEADWETLQASAEMWSADSTDYDAFRDRGGRMIVWHGTGDPAFSGYELMSWHDRVREAYGEEADDFARLFFMPNVHHCAGGDGLASFDPLQALVDWVERDTPPDMILTAAVPGTAHEGRSRPACPYPLQSRYDGTGDPEDSSSFTCEAP